MGTSSGQRSARGLVRAIHRADLLKSMNPTMQRILIVDDNRDSAESLAMLLSMTGNETQTAHDGVSAVEVAGSFKPDVILLDIGLPRMNGYDVCRAIRDQEWGKGILMVAVTGWGQEDDRRRSQLAGFDTHLVKPVEYSELVTLLASHSSSSSVS